MAQAAEDSMLDTTLCQDGGKDSLTSDFGLIFEENRRKTFKDWPFEEPAKCTADAMAQAGFVHRPVQDSPDAAQCFFCCKELDGWEPSDDPWDEHVSHTGGKCKFLTNAKTFETTMNIKKLLQLEKERQKNIVKAKYEKLKQRVRDQAQVVRKHMQHLV